MKAFKTFVSAAVLAAALVGVDAQAATTTYVVSGTFTNGEVLSGSFDQTPQPNGAFSFDLFTNIAIKVGSRSIFNYTATGSNGAGAVGILFENADGESTRLYGPSQGNTFNYASAGGSLFTFSSLNIASGTFFLQSGTITPQAAASAVPEPANWAMMLVGVGLIGGAGRYRRRKTIVAFG